MLVATGARRVISAKRRTADGNLLRIDILACQEIVDALADRYFVVRPRRNLVTAQRAALTRAVDHENRDAPLQRAMRLHKPHLVLDRVQTSHADENRLPAGVERRPDEIGEQRLAVLIGNLQHFARWPEVLDELSRAFLHV